MNNVEIIDNWRKYNPTFGLVLPIGWFGRPFDNQHSITWITDRKYKLLIEVDEQLLFIITKSNQFEIVEDKNDLVIRNFYRLTFDRLSYGDFSVHTDFYENGELKLISYK